MKHRVGVLAASGRRLASSSSGTALWSELFGSSPSEHFLEISEPVLLDIDATVLGVEIVDGGELIFDPDSSRLLRCYSHAFMVMDGGKITMEPADAAITHELRFVNIDESVFTSGGTIDTIDHHTNPGLMIMNGSMRMIGAAKTGWTRTTTGLSAGATSCTVVDASGWRIGDEIVITPTQLKSVSEHWRHYDRRTLTNVVGNVLTFAALTYAHPSNTSPGSGAVIYPEVVNLTRNVKISGDFEPGSGNTLGATDTNGRAHIMFMGDCPELTWRYVEGLHLGPRQFSSTEGTQVVLGRYACHFHLMGEGARGTEFVGVSMHDIGSRVYVPHGTNGVTFTDCIAWSYFQNGFWWDTQQASDASDDITYDRCFAGRSRADQSSSGVINSGFQLDHGTNLVCINCCVAALDGGIDTGGYNWPETANVFTPDNHWTFTNNDSHNNNEHGIFVWQNDVSPHVVGSARCWNNSGAGILAGAYFNMYHYQDLDLFHNGDTGDFALHAQSWGNANPAPTDVRVDRGYIDFFVIAHHVSTVATSDHPAVMQNIEIGFPIYVAESGGNSQPGFCDFIDCGKTMPGGVIIETMNPDSIIRIQEGASAWRVTSTGYTSIPVFWP